MNGERFLTYLEFVQTFNVTIDLLYFNSVISAVKKYLSRNKLPNITNKTIPYQPALNFIMNTTKGASAIYHSMLEPDEKNKGFLKWQRNTQITLNEWKKVSKF